MNLKSAGIISGEGKLPGANLYGGIGRVGNHNILVFALQWLDQNVYQGNTELKSFTPTRLASDNLEMEPPNQFDLGGILPFRNGLMGSLNI